MLRQTGKLLAFLAIPVLLTIICVSQGTMPTQSTYTVSGRVSGSWNCPGIASPMPMTAILLPLKIEAHFTRPNPEIAFEGVPDGDYTLVACCCCGAESRNGSAGDGMPITVSGADVFVDLVLPFPALPRHTPTITLTGNTGYVLDLAFSPDGAVLVSASNEGTFTRWNPATGERESLSHGNPYRDSILSPGGKTLAVATVLPAMIELWDTERGERLHTLRNSAGDMRPLAFSPAGATLAVEEKDWIVEESRFGVQITLWDVATGERLRALGEGQNVRLAMGLDFLQNGATVVLTMWDNAGRTSVVWWDAATGNRLRSFPLSQIEDIQHYSVHKMAASPDETHFAFGLSGVEGFGGLVIWDMSTGRTTTNYYPTSACDLAFSPDGTLIASATGDNTIVLWNATTGEARYVLASDSAGVCEMAWSHDGKTLAAGAGDGRIFLWQML